MIVMKFGGSSVESAEAIGRVAAIVRGQQDRRPVVVVSAMAKTTRKLLEAADAAAAGEDFSGRFEELREYHRREAPAGAHGVLESYFSELRGVLEQVAAERRVTPRLADQVAGFGELISSAILASVLGSPWIDCRQVVVTDGDFTRAKPIYEETEPRLREALLPHLREGRVPVLGGYVGSTLDGVTTTLGYEGSDFSAAIVGAAIGAEEVQIWTDVDGILTADPRIVRDARRVKTLSFDEALELSCSGMKKPHHGTLGPAHRADVPIRILNSLHRAEGTLIGRRSPAAAIKSIACKPGVRQLTVHGPLERIWEVCERFRPALLTLGCEEDRTELSLDRPDRLSEIREAFESFAEVQVGPGRTVVSIVSEDLATSPGLAETALEAAGPWEPRLVLQGVSAPCVRCLVDEEEEAAVISELHHRIFQGPEGEPIE